MPINFRRLQHRVGNTGLFVIGLAAVIIYLFPLYWMVVTSLKPADQLFVNPPTLYPYPAQFDGYREVVGLPIKAPVDRPVVPGLRYLLNTLRIALGTTVLTLLLAVPGAYALSRFRLRINSFFLLTLLVTQMLPSVLVVIPLFIIFKTLNLVNTFTAVILANTAMVLPLTITILRTSFLMVPKEIEEAALIDGCNRLQSLFRVILPLVRAGVVTVGAFAFLFAWGEFVFALSFLQNDKLHPISLAIFKFVGQYITEWNSMMAFSTVVALPAMIVFILLQRHFVQGLAAGAVK